MISGTPVQVNGEIGGGLGSLGGGSSTGGDPYGVIAMQKAGQLQEFSIQTEDFPALPGASAQAREGGPEGGQPDLQQSQSQVLQKLLVFVKQRQLLSTPCWHCFLHLVATAILSLQQKCKAPALPVWRPLMHPPSISFHVYKLFFKVLCLAWVHPPSITCHE